MARFAVGDIVRDREDEEAIMLVLDPDCGEAAAVEIPDLEATVAEVNAGYPPDDRVVRCVHLEWLDHHVGDRWRDWERWRVDEALERFTTEWNIPLKRYSYPESRLQLEERAEPPPEERSPDGQSSLGDWSG